jgi:hypothetical protein
MWKRARGCGFIADDAGGPDTFLQVSALLLPQALIQIIYRPATPAFVTRLQPFRLPGRAARQLPDQSTTLRVESSSTGNPRLRGALPIGDIDRAVNSLPAHR